MEYQDKLSRAIQRNIHEVFNARIEQRAWNGLRKSSYLGGLDFFRIASRALHNDMISHAIKVLDRNKQSATFWYIYDSYKKNAKFSKIMVGRNITKVEQLAGKLKCIRDKTHFHIDKKGVLDPKKIWKDAGVKKDNFVDVLDMIWDILNRIYKIHFNKEFLFDEYTGDDVAKIIDLYMANH